MVSVKVESVLVTGNVGACIACGVGAGYAFDLAVIEGFDERVSFTNCNADRVSFFGINFLCAVKAVGFTVVTCDNEGLAAEVYIFEAGELAVAGGSVSTVVASVVVASVVFSLPLLAVVSDVPS